MCHNFTIPTVLANKSVFMMYVTNIGTETLKLKNNQVLTRGYKFLKDLQYYDNPVKEISRIEISEINVGNIFIFFLQKKTTLCFIRYMFYTIY